LADFGYAGEILKVDLSEGKTIKLPTSDYAGRFIGGRGIGAKIYWDEVPPEVGAFDPGNKLIFMNISLERSFIAVNEARPGIFHVRRSTPGAMGPNHR